MLLSVHERVERWRHDQSSVVEFWRNGQHEALSAAELAQACCDWAAALQAERCEIVAVAGRSTLQCYAAYLGAFLAGKTPVFVPYSSERLGPSAFRARLDDLRALLGNAVYVGDNEDFRDADVRVVSAPTKTRTPDLPKPHAAFSFIQCSSGSTGRQKAVRVGWAALAAQLESYARSIALRADDRFVSWLPVYHDMGLVANFLLPLLSGLPLFVLDPFEWARAPRRLLEVIEHVAGTLCFMPNFAYALLARVAPGPKLDSVRLFVNSGEPPTERAMKSFAERHAVPLARIRTAYGLAENVFAVTQSSAEAAPRCLDVDPSALSEGRVAPSDANGLRLVSNGVPLANMEVVVRAAPGRDVGAIFVRSPSRVAGYLGGPDFSDDWLETGDLGFWHGGELFVCGREKSLIIVQGRNLFPTDLEEAAGLDDSIAPGRLLALGVPSELDTETLLLLAEPKEARGIAAARATEARLRQQLEQRFGVPAEVRVVPRRWLVKTTSGKIARQANLTRYLHARNRVIHVVGDSTVRGLSQRYANLRTHWLGVLHSAELDKFLPRIETLLADAGPDDVLVIASGEPECRVPLPAAPDPDAYLAIAMAAYEKFLRTLGRRWAGRLAFLIGIPTNAVTVGPVAPDPNSWPKQGWLPPISTPERRYRLQAQFYQRLRAVCEVLAIPVIDGFTPFLAADDQLAAEHLDTDGIHLNARGNDVLCDAIFETLGFLEAPGAASSSAWDGSRASYRSLLAAKLSKMAGAAVPLNAIFSSGLLSSLALVELIDFLNRTFGVSVDLMEDFVSERFDDAEALFDAVIDGAGVPARRVGPQLTSTSRFLPHFFAHYAPKLGHRKETFQRTIEFLEGLDHAPTIVETGTADLTISGFLSHGRSTALFDDYVGQRGDAQFHSVDVSPRPAQRSRSLLGRQTQLWCGDSVEFLANFGGRIDVLYLDSLDIDWHDPHPSALQHARELCAALPKLRAGSLVVVDDNEEHEVGKAGYLHDLMDRLGARKVFEHYQIGWCLPDTIEELHAWGNRTPAELAAAERLTLQRWFRYERVGHDVRQLELLRGGLIGAGASRCEQLWFVQTATDGDVELVLAGHGRITCRLREAAGVFHGRWRLFERMPVRLSAVAPLAPRELAEKLAGHRRYRLIRKGVEERVLELGAAGSIDHGASTRERMWTLSAALGAEPSLEFLGDTGCTSRLRRRADGSWLGRSLLADASEVALVPLTAATLSELQARARLGSGSPIFVDFYGKSRAIELRPSGDVRFGAALGAETWRTELVDGVVELRLAAAGEDSLRFREGPNGEWQGSARAGEPAALRTWRMPMSEVTSLTGGVFRYVREGYDERPLSFGAGGFVELGSAECEWAWQLAETEAGLELELWGIKGVTARLKRAEQRWLGRWEVGERMPVRLEPLTLPGELGNWVFFEIMLQRLFRYRREGHDERILELKRDQSIGRGNGKCEQLWRVELSNGRVELVISGAGIDTCRLGRNEDGSWSGQWLVHERMPVALWPLTVRSAAPEGA